MFVLIAKWHIVKLWVHTTTRAHINHITLCVQASALENSDFYPFNNNYNRLHLWYWDAMYEWRFTDLEDWRSLKRRWFNILPSVFRRSTYQAWETWLQRLALLNSCGFHCMWYKWKSPSTPRPIQGLQISPRKSRRKLIENSKDNSQSTDPVSHGDKIHFKPLLGAPQSAHVLFCGCFISSNIAPRFFSDILIAKSALQT